MDSDQRSGCVRNPKEVVARVGPTESDATQQVEVYENRQGLAELTVAAFHIKIRSEDFGCAK